MSLPAPAFRAIVGPREGNPFMGLAGEGVTGPCATVTGNADQRP